MKPDRRLTILLILILLGAALRIYQIQRFPWSGDEAFAVRYWAAPPADVLSDLAWHEPHPFGTFFGFWAWKSLVGDSEFAMRLLPALVNLLGIPAIYALARRLTRMESVALGAALLWAINPNQIWHAQEVRNYAIWSALSVMALWLLLRASKRSRRIDWLLYIVVTTLSLYIFFLEAFIIVVHGLYVILFRRQAFRAWAMSMLVIGVLLIPWMGQLWALAHGSYQGTAPTANLADLFTRFWPALVFGEVSNAPLIFAVLLVCCMPLVTGIRMRSFLFLLLAVPSGLLVLAATRLSVFWARYLIAATPAVLILLAFLLNNRRFSRALRIGLVGVFATLILVPTISGLADYYSPAYRKAPDWYGLRDYLRAHAAATDSVIMTSEDPSTGYGDPAFEFYYSGPAHIVTLPHPQVDTVQAVQQELKNYRSVWSVMVSDYGKPIDDALAANGMLISDQWAGQSFRVREYRDRQVKPAEIESPLALSLGQGTLIGYSLDGQAHTGLTLIVLLYWQHAPAPTYHAFVHLIGPAKPDGSPLWTQFDHPPTAPGRDVYPLDLTNVPSGTYSIEIGLYDPNTGQRVQISDGTGKLVGDSTILSPITVQ